MTWYRSALATLSAFFVLLLAPSAHAATEGTAKTATFLQGTLGLVVVAGLVFVAIFLLAWMFFGSKARRGREEQLARLAALRPTGVEGKDPQERQTLAALMPDSFVSGAASVARASGHFERIEWLAERAGSSLSPGEIVGLSALAGIVTTGAGLLLGAGPLVAPVLGLVGVAVPCALLLRRSHHRSKLLNEQLPDTLTILASSLRAGHSFLQSLDMVATEIGEPASGEFKRLVAEIRLGRPVGEALASLGDRIDNPDFRWAMLAVNVQRDTGGNLAEVLDTVADTLRERAYVRRQVQALSAEGRMSMYVLTVLPFAVGGWIALTNPEYIGLLVTTGVGRVMLATGASLLLIGVAWMRKLVKIDV